MMRLKKSLLKIGKVPCSVVQFNFTAEKDKIVIAKRIHFIQILDRSESMKLHIDQLIDNVKKTIKVMKPNDLLSIIWFSGPGECKTVLRGASIATPSLSNQIDKLKSTLGSTCFSEALMETGDIVNDLADLCDNFVITLFTDGQPVVPWSIKEEEFRTKDILKSFNEKILSFNTIGYGVAYNSNFLKELASLSKFGRHSHSSMINQYLPIFKHNVKSVENSLKEVVNIESKGNSILYLTKKNSKIASDKLNINLLSKNYNKFYIISTSAENFKIQINDEIFNSSIINEEISQKDLENLLYTLVYEKYYQGKSDEALDILINSIKDKYLINLIINSFTSQERQQCEDILLKAAHNRKINLKSRIWVMPRLMNGTLTGNNFEDNVPCFVELLRKFNENKDKFIPLSSKQYKRIGKKVVDNYNSFKSDSSVKLLADFKDLVYTKDRLNISIRYEIPGFVTINPRQAKAVGLKTNVFPSKIYREQTIIKDGEININKLTLLVSKKTLSYLNKLKIEGLFTTIENKQILVKGYTLIELTPSKIPILNRSYILKSDNLDYLLDAYYKQRESECKQKVLKFFIENQMNPKEVRVKKYSKNQIALLESYGLDSKGVYRGIDNKIVKEFFDQYQCRIFEFSLKGFSTLPKVDDLLKKIKEDNKKLNGPETLMMEYVQYLKENKFDTSYEMLTKLLEEEKAIIRENTKTLAEIKLAKSLTGGWWEGLKLGSRGNYIYEKGDRTLIIKVIKRTVSL
ncbi:MAG: hypothetical protein AB6733_07765 [Clostridiaceae bacterium]